MSQKWIRSKQWDDRHIPPALWPLRLVLRAFSSIPLAVCLLSCVALYGILASVPVGLIALAPTFITYGLTVGLALVVFAVLPARGILILMRRAGAGFGVRFAAGLVLLIGLGVMTVWGWHAWAWPALRFDPSTGRGLRFFAGFVEEHKATTIRRLRGMEMSELEFYGWWPLKVILLAFVANMVTTTVRRIEFTFHNIGVLTVHTGIVTIALGSVWYSRLKEEGDMLLTGAHTQEGNPLPGPVETGFFDNTRVALWATMDTTDRWQMRPLSGLPRYHDYNLRAGLPEEARPTEDGSEQLNLSPPPPAGPDASIVDSDIRFRVVGYGAYVELEPTWAPGKPEHGAAEPLRQIELVRRGAPAGDRAPRLLFVPGQPSARINSLANVLSVEYTRGMSEQRWSDLRAPLPPGSPDHPASHALVIEVPGKKAAEVYAVEPGTVISVGNTGYVVEVTELLAEPPFPILTTGYQGAQSSVAVVHVAPPAGTGPGSRAFDRYIYHRFPEISQDLLDEKNERGMPKRRDADPAIRIGYIDATVAQVYFDEVPGSEGNDPPVRAIIRSAGGQARVIENLKTGSQVQVAPEAFLRLGERWASVVPVERPVQVPEAQRDNKLLGTHQHAAMAVEVTSEKAPGWKDTVWLPYAQYLTAEADLPRTVPLPDGRRVTLEFGRIRRVLPGIALELVDFHMTPYPGSENSQDYRSDVLVLRTDDASAPQTRYTSLNDPLLVRVPFQRRTDLPWIANAVGWMVSHIAPTQYKFSQAGWDQRGWTKSKSLADAGQLKRAFANFTILGVGNNPGIYVIATGAVMMSVGIPWAFYVKPLLVKAKKRRIQRQVAAGVYVPPKDPRVNGVAGHRRPAATVEAERSGANT